MSALSTLFYMATGKNLPRLQLPRRLILVGDSWDLYFSRSYRKDHKLVVGDYWKAIGHWQADIYGLFVVDLYKKAL